MGLAERLIRWQRQAGRHDLPWQGSRDPYRIWVSEIMLQQTQVATVAPYYRRFTARFPDLAALAAAPLEHVLACWSGLGYYARARNLHACARVLVERHGGCWPGSAAQLAQLPGVGRSTAAAIAAFAYGERAAILDGNVRRVLCRHFGVEGVAGSAALERALWRLAERELPERDVDVYTQALMDLGATVCLRAAPRCDVCPVAADCVAHREQRTAELPVPRRRAPVPERHGRLIALRRGDHVLLERRPANGIWGGLWSLPELCAHEPSQIAHEAAVRFGVAVAHVEQDGEIRHAFTHFRLRAQLWLAEAVDRAVLRGAARPPAASNGMPLPAARDAEDRALWLSLPPTADAPLPRPIRTVLLRLAQRPR